ncbi:MAG: prepilin-type N-terminal cleavage/methylation domain-containing protein [Firmicutes bacterium]|nr:prepilin-type N-terminal cleavage/methylation domain-containing protein [Bacillota bacterium]
MQLLKKQNGFTLIELLLVLALLSLLLKIAFPRLELFSRWRLEGAARLLASDLRYVQQEAVVSGQKCQIVFYTFDNSYRLEFPEEKKRIYLPQGVFFEGTTSFPGDPPYVHFNNLGHPSSGGTIILRNDQQQQLYVIVAPVNGRVRISKEPPGAGD